MKESLRMERDMEKEKDIIDILEKNIQENIQMVKKMEKEKIIIQRIMVKQVI